MGNQHDRRTVSSERGQYRYQQTFGQQRSRRPLIQNHYGLSVAPGLRAQGRAFAPDMILDGNLGMPFLHDKVLTLDLATGRLWIAPAPAPRTAATPML